MKNKCYKEYSIYCLILQLGSSLQLQCMEKSFSIAKDNQSSFDRQRKCMLCQLPLEILNLITGHLGTWKEINNFGTCCKYLDENVTSPLKPLIISCSAKRKKNQPPKEFLDPIQHLIHRIVKKNGNNNLELLLSTNLLEDDNKALKQFISNCCIDEVVQYITALDIANNRLTRLPQEIRSLYNLKSLSIGENFIKNPKDINVITNLKNLEHLYLACLGLKKLPNDIKNLKKLKRLSINDNRLDKEVFSILLALENLEDVYLGRNLFTHVDILRSMTKHPSIKIIYAGNLELGDYNPEEFQNIQWLSPDANIYG